MSATTDHPRRIPLFLYGLFMDADTLRARGLAPATVRPARVRGMRLVIGRRAALVADPDGVVHGMLMDLTHDEIGRLYAEPGVADYRPEAVTAEPAGEAAVAALCFNLPALSPGEPDPQYTATLRALAGKLGLPAEYLRSVR